MIETLSRPAHIKQPRRIVSNIWTNSLTVFQGSKSSRQTTHVWSHESKPWVQGHESCPSGLTNPGHESGPRPSWLRNRYDLTSEDMTLIIVLSLSVTALVKSILCVMFLGICLNLRLVLLDFWWNDVFGWWDFRKRKGFINNNLISPLNICSEFNFGFSFIKVFKVIWNQRIKNSLLSGFQGVLSCVSKLFSLWPISELINRLNSEEPIFFLWRFFLNQIHIPIQWTILNLVI